MKNKKKKVTISPIRQYLNEVLTDENPEACIFDDLDDAILGTGNQYTKPSLVIYSQKKIIDILIKRDGMTHEEALEFFDFNIYGAWIGEGTPIILMDMIIL